MWILKDRKIHGSFYVDIMLEKGSMDLPVLTETQLEHKKMKLSWFVPSGKWIPEPDQGDRPISGYLHTYGFLLVYCIYLGASYVPKVDLKTQSKQLSGYCTSPLGCIPDVSQSPSRTQFSGAPRPESRAPRPGRQSSRTLLFSSFRQRPPIPFGCSVVFSPPLSYLRWCSSQPSFPNSVEWNSLYLKQSEDPWIFSNDILVQKGSMGLPHPSK